MLQTLQCYRQIEQYKIHSDQQLKNMQCYEAQSILNQFYVNVVLTSPIAWSLTIEVPVQLSFFGFCDVLECSRLV